MDNDPSKKILSQQSWNPDILGVAQEQPESIERFLRAPIAAHLMNARQSREAVLIQMLGDRHGVDLSGYLAAAKTLQDPQVEAGLQVHDLLGFVRSEALRVAEVSAHIRKWRSIHKETPPLPNGQAIFARKEMKEQVAPLNGPTGTIPTAEQCRLLAIIACGGTRLIRVDEDHWAVRATPT